jgi:hypothetical protein
MEDNTGGKAIDAFEQMSALMQHKVTSRLHQSWVAQQHEVRRHSFNRCRVAGWLVLLIACLLSLSLQSVHAEPLSPDLQTTLEQQAHDKRIGTVAYATIRAGKIFSTGIARG